MIDLTTISLLRVKSLIDTPEKCEIFHRYTPLIYQREIPLEKIAEILVENKGKDSEEKSIEEVLKNLFADI